jgi:acyl carrier protein
VRASHIAALQDSAKAGRRIMSASWLADVSFVGWHADCCITPRGPDRRFFHAGTPSMQNEIRSILAQSGRLAVPVDSLDANADLFAAGLDSLAIVNVLMRIEEQFDIELPDEMLSRRSFSSIATITRVVTELTDRTVNT